MAMRGETRGQGLLLAAVATLAGTAADADLVKVAASNGVDATMDALEAAVDDAGATVFARVDHGAGAAGAGLELGAAQLLIFGNPKLGTPAMQDAPEAGLFLPLRVLVFEDAEGAVWLTYQEPAEMLGAVDPPADAPYLKQMSGVLAKLTAAAAE